MIDFINSGGHINQAAAMSLALNLTSFSVAVWLQTATTSYGIIVGSSDALFSNYVWIEINAPSAGQIRVGMHHTIRTRNQWYTLPVFDDKPHCIVVTRNDPVANFKVYLDGSLLTITGASGLLTSSAIATAQPFGVGALRLGAGYNSYAVAKLGEFAWWNTVLTDDEISSLAAGRPADLISAMPQEYWPAFDQQLALPAVDAFLAGSPAPSPANTHAPIIRPSGLIETAINPGIGGGYDFYSKSGQIPVPGSDLPIRRFDRTITTLAINESELGLIPLTTHFLAVAAFNLSGHSTPSVYSFPVDAAGHVMTTPAIVSGLFAIPLSGGRLRIGWDYDELLSFAVADQFRITFEPLSGQATPAAIVVTHAAPQRSYQVITGALADGAYRVRCFSERAGKYQSAVTGVDTRTDATPPVGSVVGLTAF